MTIDRATALFALCGLTLVGCESSPPPRRPTPQPTRTAAPPQASPSPAEQTEIPTIRSSRSDTDDGPRTVVIRSERFPPEIMALRANDLVEVELTRGGTARGRLRSLSADELTIAAQGSTILTRLEPRDVVSARVIYRASIRRPKDVVGDEPKNERETWLEQFADREVFNGDARRLWLGRFRANTTLVVHRPFEVEAVAWAATTSTKTFFARTGRATFDVGDELKLVGVSQGVEQLGTTDQWLGEVNLLLRRRDGRVSKLYTPTALAPSNFERDGLATFLEAEPVTFVVSHPGEDEELVRILRVDAKLARAYMRAIERLPGRVAMRRMRAQSSRDLASAEAEVRSLYGRFGLNDPQDLGLPLQIRTRVPMLVGTLRMVDFKQEVGLD